MPDSEGSGAQNTAGALERLQELAVPLAMTGIGKVLVHMKSIISPYPPQPPRDRAKTFNTYMRGIGRLPRSAFVEAGGKWTINRKKALTAGWGGQIRFTSQNLGKRWETNVTQQASEIIGELKNDTTYAGYVHGHRAEGAGDGIPRQYRPHTQTGWRSVDDALDTLDTVLDKMAGEVADQLVHEIVSS